MDHCFLQHPLWGLTFSPVSASVGWETRGVMQRCTLRLKSQESAPWNMGEMSLLGEDAVLSSLIDLTHPGVTPWLLLSYTRVENKACKKVLCCSKGVSKTWGRDSFMVRQWSGSLIIYTTGFQQHLNGGFKQKLTSQLPESIDLSVGRCLTAAVPQVGLCSRSGMVGQESSQPQLHHEITEKDTADVNF